MPVISSVTTTPPPAVMVPAIMVNPVNCAIILATEIHPDRDIDGTVLAAGKSDLKVGDTGSFCGPFEPFVGKLTMENAQ